MERHTFFNREIISSLLWIGVGVVFCIGAVEHGLVDEVGAGPGLLPFMAGILLSGLGMVVLISTCRSVTTAKGKEETEPFFPEKESLRKVFMTLLGLSLYVFAFEYLGFLLTNFLGMIFLMRFIEPNRWKTVWIVSLITAGSFQVVFRMLLKVPFPRGILGI